MNEILESKILQLARRLGVEEAHEAVRAGLAQFTPRELAALASRWRQEANKRRAK